PRSTAHASRSSTSTAPGSTGCSHGPDRRTRGHPQRTRADPRSGSGLPLLGLVATARTVGVLGPAARPAQRPAARDELLALGGLLVAGARVTGRLLQGLLGGNPGLQLSTALQLG